MCVCVCARARACVSISLNLLPLALLCLSCLHTYTHTHVYSLNLSRFLSPLPLMCNGNSVYLRSLPLESIAFLYYIYPKRKPRLFTHHVCHITYNDGSDTSPFSIRQRLKGSGRNIVMKLVESFHYYTSIGTQYSPCHITILAAVADDAAVQNSF
jgi:hypothetical protein